MNTEEIQFEFIKNKNLVNSILQVINYFRQVGVKSTNGLIKINWFTGNSVKYNPENPSGFSVSFDKHLDEFVCELTGYMEPLLMMNGIGWELIETGSSLIYVVYDPVSIHFSVAQKLKFLTYKEITW